MNNERKHPTSEEKVAILSRHLIDKVPVSTLCDECQLHPTVFYRGLQQFFENGAAVWLTTPATLSSNSLAHVRPAPHSHLRPSMLQGIVKSYECVWLQFRSVLAMPVRGLMVARISLTMANSIPIRSAQTRATSLTNALLCTYVVLSYFLMHIQLYYLRPLRGGPLDSSSARALEDLRPGPC